MRGVFFACWQRRLLGDRALEHAIELLVRRIAARLAGLGSGERLVGGRLRTVSSVGSVGGSAVGGISRRKGSKGFKRG